MHTTRKDNRNMIGSNCVPEHGEIKLVESPHSGTKLLAT